MHDRTALNRIVERWLQEPVPIGPPSQEGHDHPLPSGLDRRYNLLSTSLANARHPAA